MISRSAVMRTTPRPPLGEGIPNSPNFQEAARQILEKMYIVSNFSKILTTKFQIL